MKTIKNIILVIAISMASISLAQIAPVDDNGLAIGGYDVVAYFSGKAEKGLESYSAKYNGVTYYFANITNSNAFKKAPKKYLPQFDGYCAWGVGEKETKFPINPETFDIVDGKLYLFFNGPFNGAPFNTLEPWEAETSRLIKAAHKNWDKINKSN
ncbi:YHS domain protein [Aureisphaera sp. CAU 1614]|uniref:YHS domain protein n=1 Tax=Halomarinibacterium sedimenti TaxID=2857106 RepID=A0A9X1FM40_9FLAO|nr:YHS domain-containing (seleno)protein [Halomarinibacterium sedimenti]MBW2936773.1 YHS domain protein [Halomarinibacterium sedimenti]